MLLLLTFTALLVLWLPPLPDEYVLGSKKKEALMKSIPSPRIVLVGGSNVAMSVNSEKIEVATHRKTINMAVTVGYGLEYILNEAKFLLMPGDIVVLMPEYHYFYGDDFAQGDENLLTLLNHSAYARSVITTSQWLNLSKLVPKYLQIVVKKNIYRVLGISQQPVFKLSAFNERGDVVSHLDDVSQKKDRVSKYLLAPHDTVFNYRSLALLTNFCRDVKQMGVIPVISFPTIPEPEYQGSEMHLIKLKKIFQKANLPVISAPERYVLAGEYFFDTSYHLLRAGREIRTQQLIQDFDTSHILQANHYSRTFRE